MVCEYVCVVWLKGGDLMLFGCVEEEMCVFEVVGIDYEVVLGIIVVLVGVVMFKCLFMLCGVLCSVVFVMYSCVLGSDEICEVVCVDLIVYYMGCDSVFGIV